MCLVFCFFFQKGRKLIFFVNLSYNKRKIKLDFLLLHMESIYSFLLIYGHTLFKDYKPKYDLNALTSLYALY